MPTPPPPSGSKKPDLTRDLDHNGLVDAADDPSRDLDHDGMIDSEDRQQQDLNQDHVIDSSDRQVGARAAQAQQNVGTSMGWSKEGDTWLRPDTSTTQEQSQGRKVS